MATYSVGQSVLLEATFRDVGGSLSDPTTVTLDVTPPGSDRQTSIYGLGTVIVRTGLGTYEAIVAATAAGQWFYRWHGETGDITPTDEDDFYVEPRRT